MRLAIPVYDGRVSPVLDVARRLLLVDADGTRELARRDAVLTGTSLLSRVSGVRELGVQVLICGAVSWPLEAALAAAGIHLVPRVCGPVDEVLAAFLAGRLSGAAYLMPGCCRRRRLRRGPGRGRAGPRFFTNEG